MTNRGCLLSARKIAYSPRISCDGSARMNLALFDFDGTLTDSDTYSPFVRVAVRPSRMLVGRLVIGPMVIAYRLGIVSAAATRTAVSRVGFRGEPVSRLGELGRLYATEVLPKTLRSDAMERLEWHRTQGDEIAVVSASLDVYLQPWCDRLGLHCICTQLEQRDGRCTGRYVRGDCSGAEKARRVVERFDPHKYAVIYAYGDTDEDRQMLEIAHRRFYRWREVSSESAF